MTPPGKRTRRERRLARAMREGLENPRFALVTWLYIGLSLVIGWAVPRLTASPLHVSAIGPDQVTAFLSAVSTGMMAFTGIVFSLLFVVMQFGSSAYSPHLVAMLSRSPTLMHAQGVFTGTFLYTLMALRGVGATVNGGTASLTVWVAFAWLLASVFLLVRLVRVFATMEISDVLHMLGDSGRRQIVRLYAPAGAQTVVATVRPRDVTQTLVYQGPPRYVVDFDTDEIVALAREADALVRIPLAIGDAISFGTTLAVVEGARAPVPEERLRAAVVVGRDRTHEESPKNAIRLLVDIAIRALSPAVSDPTTTVHSLDEIEDLLVRIGGCALDIGRVTDRAGCLRLVHAAPTWEEYLELGLTEIQQHGARSVQVERRLGAVLDLLRERVPASRQPAVAKFAEERSLVARRAFELEEIRERAVQRDRQGLGHTTDLHA